MARIGELFSRIEIWVALILVAVSVYEPAHLPIALAGFFVLTGLRYFLYRHLTRRTWIDLPILILFMMSVIALGISLDRQRTWEQVMRLWVGIGLFYSLVNWIDSPSRLKWLTGLIMVAGFLLALIAPFITIWNEKFLFPNFSIPRLLPNLAGNPANPNVLAGSLGLFFLLGFGLFLFGRAEFDKVEKVILVITMVSTGGLLIATQSRGAILAALSGCLLIISSKFKRGWLIFLFLIPLIILTGYQRLWAQFLNFITAGSTISGFLGRTEIWSRAIFMLEDYPFTGIGMGLFGPVADTLYPFYEYPTQTVEHAHNLFLQIGVDLGIPGLVSWLAILGLSLVAAARITIVAEGGWLKGLGAGLLASQAFVILHGLTDSVVWGMVRPSPLIWLFWGISIGAYQMLVRSGHEEIP